MSLPANLQALLSQPEPTRVVAFGSSNTERRLPGMHWFDCLELACRLAHRTPWTFINSGIGGHTTLDLLDRIERDCLAYRPHLVIITVGGNDSNPLKAISPTQYHENLTRILDLIREHGGEPVLQTYYSFDLEAITHVPPEIMDLFPRIMEETRRVAHRQGCYLIDHLPRWEQLRHRHPAMFRSLLTDPTHLNPTGNLLFGLDIVRAFGLTLPEAPEYREARGLQLLFDTLSAME